MSFFLQNFLIIGLCNSSANFLLDIILYLIAPSEADLSASKADFFYQNIYKPSKQVHTDIHHILDF